ncbi:MAG: isocitrate/isopropylmalate family dehydrogenase [Pseudomonadota bacterium]
MSDHYRIAVIPGDGIGKEVVPEGLKVLESLAPRFNLSFEFEQFDWSCETWLETGAMMPQDGIEQLRGFDSIFLGAVGFPSVPDHISLWGLLIPIRREFHQYINLRPVRLFEGAPCPLANRKPGDIDFYVVRENCEGEYSNVGGRLYAGTPDEVVMQQSIFTRKGVDRVLQYAFDLAQSRPAKHLTSATKSNGIIHTMPFWDECVEAMQSDYPGRGLGAAVGGASRPSAARGGRGGWVVSAAGRGGPIGDGPRGRRSPRASCRCRRGRSSAGGARGAGRPRRRSDRAVRGRRRPRAPPARTR